MVASKCVFSRFGSKTWYNDNGVIHREDGPAFENAKGEKLWFLDGVALKEKEFNSDFKSKIDEHGIERFYNKLNQLHREDGPALESVSDGGKKQWYLDGVCLDEKTFLLFMKGEVKSPCESEYKNPIIKQGIKYWFNDKGEFHRLDGPAIEYPDGTKCWYQNGERHRLDGPAIDHYSGIKSWYKNDKLHREDGPALRYEDGSGHFYLEGNILTEKEFNSKVKMLNSKCITDAAGDKNWYNDQHSFHREDGPAREFCKR